MIAGEKAELHPFETMEKSLAQWAAISLLNLLSMEGYHESLCPVTYTVQRNSNHLHLQPEPKHNTAHQRGKQACSNTLSLSLHTTDIFFISATFSGSI